MSKQFCYWVIVMGAQPTAFRARRPEDLQPTLRQLQRTQPSAALMWFERNRFWESPEAAKRAYEARRSASSGRTASWRPGGAHVDPRARYELSRDEKRARFKKRLQRSDHRSPASGSPADKGEAADGRRRSSGPPGKFARRDRPGPGGTRPQNASKGSPGRVPGRRPDSHRSSPSRPKGGPGRRDSHKPNSRGRK